MDSEHVKALAELVDLVASDVLGPETENDPDEDSVGWNADGELPMTFGHVRRAQAAVAVLRAAQPAGAGGVTDEMQRALKYIAEGYKVTGRDDRYIVVENPYFEEGNGEDPNVVVDTATVCLTPAPSSEAIAEISCPVGDPDCLGADDECHDACEAPVVSHEPPSRETQVDLSTTDETQGDRCDACHRIYTAVYRVPSALWAKIAPHPETLGSHPEHQGGGLLCPDCARMRAQEIGVRLHFEGVIGEWGDAATPEPAGLDVVAWQFRVSVYPDDLASWDTCVEDYDPRTVSWEDPKDYQDVTPLVRQSDAQARIAEAERERDEAQFNAKTAHNLGLALEARAEQAERRAGAYKEALHAADLKLGKALHGWSSLSKGARAASAIINNALVNGEGR